MKTANKVFLAGMIGMVLAFGFVLASCKQVYEGTSSIRSTSGGGKAITLTLTSKSYEIQYDGKTYSGDAKKDNVSSNAVYKWTSGGEGSVVIVKKEASQFAYSNDSISIYADNLTKRSVANGEISLDDIELIIIEDDE